MSRTIKSVIAALAIATAFAPAALADTRGHETSSVRVAYGDLDAASPAGAKMLLGRIRSAANRVCADVNRSPHHLRIMMDCRRESVAAAVRQLDIPTLTLAWSGKSSTTELAAR